MKHIKFQENILEDESYNRDEPEPDLDDADSKKWYSSLPEETPEIRPLDADRLDALKKEAYAILHGESSAYETKIDRSGSSDQKWARSLLSKGAVADRAAAAVVLIQDSPLHHLTALRNLVATVKPAKKKDGLTVIESLTELFIGDLLLPDAKLRKFETRPASKLEEMSSGNRDHRRKILMNWIFEDSLKEIYGEYIKSLNSFAHDTIDAHKEKAISAMSKLLMGNPEYENVLLSNIVNKLGDPSQKVASKVIYHLCQVLYAHPNMKGVVLEEIEKMLFRSNISSKAQYYGVCFLNQFFLSKDDVLIAENLVRVYFSFFKACIKKGEIDTRLMSAILTGVKRCQPFLGHQKVEELQEQADALHRLVHLARYNISLHALALLLQIAPVATQLSDRYYCALYKKLADPETLTTTLPALMMNLVYRSIKADKCFPRVLAFLKRLLQLACLSDAPRACAFLLLVARLSRNKKIPKRWFEKSTLENEMELKEEEEKLNSNLHDELENEGTERESTEPVESNINETVNNKNDVKKNKVKSIDAKPTIKTLWEGDKLDLLQDEDEVYHDIILEEDETEFKKKFNKVLKKKPEASQGWIHNLQIENNTLEEIKEEDKNIDEVEKEKELKILIKKTKNLNKIISEYTPLNRNPAYCGAEHSVICELLQLLNHYHPTVKVFAEKILAGTFIQYGGDPLKDFSIARFLDRFAFKNPKKDFQTDEKDDNPSTITVKGSHPKFALRKNYKPGGMKSLPVNSTAYLNEDSTRIPVDEKFLYDYLQMRRMKKEEELDGESDTDSINSNEFESYLDGLGGKKANDGSDESDDEKEDVDFMTDILQNKKLENKKLNKKPATEESDDGEMSSDWSDSEEKQNNNKEDFSDIDNDSNFDLSDDDDDDDDDNDEDMKPNKKRKKATENESDIDFSDDSEEGFDVPNIKKNMKVSKKKSGVESMFASAEEFSTLLEDSATVAGHGTSQALSNAENAHTKQLSWESNRDRWVKGYNKLNSSKRNKPDKPTNSRFEKGNKGQGNKRKFNNPNRNKQKRMKF